MERVKRNCTYNDKLLLEGDIVYISEPFNFGKRKIFDKYRNLIAFCEVEWNDFEWNIPEATPSTRQEEANYLCKGCMGTGVDAYEQRCLNCKGSGSGEREDKEQTAGKLSLYNRADGVDGHYCVGRLQENGTYHEYWTGSGFSGFGRLYETKQAAEEILNVLTYASLKEQEARRQAIQECQDKLKEYDIEGVFYIIAQLEKLKK